MCGYIAQLEAKYGDLLAGAKHAPPTAHLQTLLDSPPDATPLSPADTKRFQQIVGAMVHARQLRFDTALAVAVLTKHTQAPTSVHMKHALHVLHYLISTPNVGPVLNFAEAAQSGPPRLCAHADASFACHPDHDSQGAFVYSLGRYGIPVDVKSYTFTEDPCLSACQGEYQALCIAAVRGVFLVQLLTDAGFPQTGPTALYEDNRSAVSMADMPHVTKRSRHIHIRFNYIKKLVAAKLFRVEWVPTLLQRADVLTKGNFRSVLSWVYAARFLLSGRAPPSSSS